MTVVENQSSTRFTLRQRAGQATTVIREQIKPELIERYLFDQMRAAVLRERERCLEIVRDKRHAASHTARISQGDQDESWERSES